MSELKLTPKQELFAQEYVKTSNASEAYRTAYDVSTTNDKTINPMASKLLKKDVISAKIKELQGELQDSHKITKDFIVKELLYVIEKSKENDKIDTTGINKAVDTLNKMFGHYEPKKIEHSGSLGLADFYGK